MTTTIAKTTIEKTTLASVARLCSTDSTRGAITHVLVTRTHVTATNGKALVQRHREARDNEQAEPIMVPATLAAKAGKLGDKHFAVVSLERSKANPDDVGETLTMACGDTMTAEGCLSPYPDTAGIVSDATGRAADPARVLRLAINPQLLLDAALALGWEPKKYESVGVFLSIPIPVANGDGTVPHAVTDPVVMRRTRDAGNGDVAVVMPIHWKADGK